MPLSDREHQILRDIEARLRADDPKFAKTVATTTVTSQARRQLKLAVAGFALGFLLLFGIAVHIAWGFLGFVLMLAGALHGVNMLKRIGHDQGNNPRTRLKGGLQRYLDDKRRRGDGVV